ncbi:MAG: Imm50 family immunity protein [Limisphaerales bacterium]
MTDALATQIRGSEKLTSIFGCWPSFHDGYLRRVGFVPGGDLQMAFEIHELTNQTETNGHYILTKHTRTTLRFGECESLHIESGFAGCIVFELELKPTLLEIRKKSGWAVKLGSSTDFELKLKCATIEVVEAEPKLNEPSIKQQP